MSAVELLFPILSSKAHPRLRRLHKNHFRFNFIYPPHLLHDFKHTLCERIMVLKVCVLSQISYLQFQNSTTQFTQWIHKIKPFWFNLKYVDFRWIDDDYFQFVVTITNYLDPVPVLKPHTPFTICYGWIINTSAWLQIEETNTFVRVLLICLYQTRIHSALFNLSVLKIANSILVANQY